MCAHQCAANIVKNPEDLETCKFVPTAPIHQRLLAPARRVLRIRGERRPGGRARLVQSSGKDANLQEEFGYGASELVGVGDTPNRLKTFSFSALI
jgi:hypothetical protein